MLGEATFRIGRFFADGESSYANCLGAIVFSPVATINEAPSCQSKRREPPYDERGFYKRTWHRFYAEMGLSHSEFEGTETRNETTFGLAGRITAHASYRQPGTGASTALPGQWSAIGARWFMNDGSIEGAFVHADSIVIGRYLRSYADPVGPADESNGRGLLLGLGSSFDYESRSTPALWDRILSVGLLGPMLELETRRGRLALRATLAARYAFGQVTSLAYAQVAPALATMVIKSELQSRGLLLRPGGADRRGGGGRAGRRTAHLRQLRSSGSGPSIPATPARARFRTTSRSGTRACCYRPSRRCSRSAVRSA